MALVMHLVYLVYFTILMKMTKIGIEMNLEAGPRQGVIQAKK